MKSTKLLISAITISLVAIVSVATTASAWHPDGKITKKVQNVTAGSVLSEADTEKTAIGAKPGDILKYVIEVRNDGAAHAQKHNDMVNTVMTDTLPAGIELKDNPAQRKITENLGRIEPGQKVIKEYLVKVTASKTDPITNTACFTGNSEVNDSPQQGCNPAVVKVTVPETPVTPVTPQKPATPVAAPAELPHTGPTETLFVGGIVIAIAAFATHRYIASKRALTNAFLGVK